MSTLSEFLGLPGRVTALETQQRTIMINLTNLSASFTTFASDFSKFKTDLSTFLAALPAPDTTTQTAIDGFTAQLGTMDQSVQGMDASLQPAQSTGGVQNPAPAPAGV